MIWWQNIYLRHGKCLPELARYRSREEADEANGYDKSRMCVVKVILK